MRTKIKGEQATCWFSKWGWCLCIHTGAREERGRNYNSPYSSAIELKNRKKLKKERKYTNLRYLDKIESKGGSWHTNVGEDVKGVSEACFAEQQSG